MDDGGEHVGAAVFFGDARGAAFGFDEIDGAIHFLIDHGGDAAGDVRRSERGDGGFGIVLGARGDFGEAFGEGFGDLLAIGGGPDGRAVDTGAAGVLGDGIGDEVDVLLPVLGAFVGKDDLGVAGTVDFDARVAGPGLGRADVTEQHAAAGLAKDFAAAAVIGGVVAEGLRGHAGLDVGLGDAVWRPGFGAAGLEDQRRFEGDGRGPQRVHAGRVRGQDDAERLAAREEAERAAADFAVAAVEHVEIGQTGEAG